MKTKTVWISAISLLASVSVNAQTMTGKIDSRVGSEQPAVLGQSEQLARPASGRWLLRLQPGSQTTNTVATPKNTGGIGSRYQGYQNQITGNIGYGFSSELSAQIEGGYSTGETGYGTTGGYEYRWRSESLGQRNTTLSAKYSPQAVSGLSMGLSFDYSPEASRSTSLNNGIDRTNNYTGGNSLSINLAYENHARSNIIVGPLLSYQLNLDRTSEGTREDGSLRYKTIRNGGNSTTLGGFAELAVDDNRIGGVLAAQATEESRSLDYNNPSDSSKNEATSMGAASLYGRLRISGVDILPSVTYMTTLKRNYEWGNIQTADVFNFSLGARLAL